MAVHGPTQSTWQIMGDRLEVRRRELLPPLPRRYFMLLCSQVPHPNKICHLSEPFPEKQSDDGRQEIVHQPGPGDTESRGQAGVPFPLSLSL